MQFYYLLSLFFLFVHDSVRSVFSEENFDPRLGSSLFGSEYARV